MRKNNFRFILTRNRRFVANGAVDIGSERTDVSVNVTDDLAERSVAATVLLMAVYNFIESDDDKRTIELILMSRGATHCSPVTSKLVTIDQALDETADDLPF